VKHISHSVPTLRGLEVEKIYSRGDDASNWGKNLLPFSKRKGGSSSKKIFVDTHSKREAGSRNFFKKKLLSHFKGECWRRNK
jgi:hypothetical protein